MESRNNAIYPSRRGEKIKKTYTPPVKRNDELKTIEIGSSQLNYSPRSGTALVTVVLSEPNCKPLYADKGASGADLFAYIKEPLTIKPLGRECIPTGVKVAIPDGCEIQIRPRSGLALKNGITVLNSPGTIDSSYRGEIKIILVNLSDKEFIVEPHMKIAQAVCASIKNIHFITKTEEEFEEYSTVRGSGGFGSTGV